VRPATSWKLRKKTRRRALAVVTQASARQRTYGPTATANCTCSPPNNGGTRGSRGPVEGRRHNILRGGRGVEDGWHLLVYGRTHPTRFGKAAPPCSTSPWDSRVRGATRNPPRDRPIVALPELCQHRRRPTGWCSPTGLKTTDLARLNPDGPTHCPQHPRTIRRDLHHHPDGTAIRPATGPAPVTQARRMCQFRAAGPGPLAKDHGTPPGTGQASTLGTAAKPLGLNRCRPTGLDLDGLLVLRGRKKKKKKKQTAWQGGKPSRWSPCGMGGPYDR